MAGMISPPLEALIADINQNIDAYPKSRLADENGSIKEDHRQPHKRRGNQFIRFSIHQTQFALPLQYALEIIPKPEITPLPNLPGWILGICNVRGEIVSVVELTQLLRVKPSPEFNGSNLILLQMGNMKTGLLVDKIGGIFFDGDPDHKVEKKALIDQSFAKYSKRTFVSSQYKVHLLEVAKLLPVLSEMQ